MSSFALLASESLAAAALVSIWDNAGVANVRNANATDNTKPADGFVLAAVSSGVTAVVYGVGSIITGLVGLTPGTAYYLDISSGALTATAPTSAGNLVQLVGKALSATTLLFTPSQGITL